MDPLAPLPKPPELAPNGAGSDGKPAAAAVAAS
jgi:hypothetical protein